MAWSTIVASVFILAHTVYGETCQPVEVEDETVAMLQQHTRRCKGCAKPIALFAVGTQPNEPLYADLVYQERLQVWGFQVKLINDKKLQLEDCEKADIMVISASVGAGNIKHRVDKCTKPFMSWEVGMYQFTGMSGPTNDDAWVTSAWWNTYHQDAWEETGVWPPYPTGKGVFITPDGAKSPLAAGYGPGMVDLFTVPNYGQNFVNKDKLGEGAKVVAWLPQNTSLPRPDEQKAVFFYYEKGAKLYGDRGESSSFRLAFPPYSFIYGSEPTCEELESVPPCAACQPVCKSVEEVTTSDVNPMPLSCQGVAMLDAAILMLKKEALRMLLL